MQYRERPRGIRANVGTWLRGDRVTNPYVRTCEGPCGQTRPTVRFPRTKTGRGRVCTACVVATRPRPTAAQRRRKRDLRLQREYGITAEEYDRMGRAQRWRCAICAHPPPDGQRLVVDHDHACGSVRALLCSACNLALGLLGDDPARLSSAVRYLSAHADLRAQVD
ncbi:endonuclease VII domain-containing protein [Nocardiopsis alba]|uniref:endonuclease VII domain-containing protein n=1 Tax=Nocardiopsis alba TaxID=53437 RepID=UPI003819822B